MPKLVFVTVGTSALENCLPGFAEHQQNSTIVEQVTGLLNEDAERWQRVLLNPQPAAGLPQRQSLVHNLYQGLNSFARAIGRPNMLAQSRKVSAEVASLLVMSKEPEGGEFGAGDEIYLIPSETAAGVVCAEANRLALQQRFLPAQIVCTDQLEGVRFAGDPNEMIAEKFKQNGLKRFEAIVKEKTESFIARYGSSEKDAPRILDVTGGFKGLILFAPILCKRYLHRLYYFYQEAKSPLCFTAYDFRTRFENDLSPIGGNYPPRERK